MNGLSQTATRSITAFICVIVAASFAVNAQQPQKPQDDVLRVNTELVQTAVTVVDKNGKFVDGLGREQFELTVDGKPRPITFFERVTSGTPREQQLATRGNAARAPATPAAAVVPGRRIVFFVDDLHMSPDSMNRTRQMLKRFLDDEMTPKDTVAIVSAS